MVNDPGYQSVIQALATETPVYHTDPLEIAAWTTTEKRRPTVPVVRRASPLTYSVKDDPKQARDDKHMKTLLDTRQRLLEEFRIGKQPSKTLRTVSTARIGLSKQPSEPRLV